MTYNIIDKVNNNQMTTIDFEIDDKDFNCIQMENLYKKINNFNKLALSTNIIQDNRFGYSEKLTTDIYYSYKSLIYNDIKTFHENIANYYILLDDNNILAFGNNSEFMFVYLMNEYMSDYYDEYERQNHDLEVSRYNEKFPNKQYDPYILKTEFIIQNWYKYYKEVIDYYWKLRVIISTYLKQLTITNNNINYTFDFDEESMTLKLNESSKYYSFETEKETQEFLNTFTSESLVKTYQFHYVSYTIDKSQLKYFESVNKLIKK